MSEQYKTGLIPDFMWVGEDEVKLLKPMQLQQSLMGPILTMPVVSHWPKVRWKVPGSLKMLNFFMSKDRSPLVMSGGENLHNPPSLSWHLSSTAAQKTAGHDKACPTKTSLSLYKIIKETYYRNGSLSKAALEFFKTGSGPQIVDKGFKLID